MYGASVLSDLNHMDRMRFQVHGETAVPFLPLAFFQFHFCMTDIIIGFRAFTPHCDLPPAIRAINAGMQNQRLFLKRILIHRGKRQGAVRGKPRAEYIEDAWS